MTEAEVLSLFERCSNAGRFGADDERGTLNYITAEKTLQALALVEHGACVSIGRDLAVRGSRETPPSAMHVLTYAGREPTSTQDILVLKPHGYEMTHLDALAHSVFRGRLYNGRRAEEEISAEEGVRFGSIVASRNGIVTRGVLLDAAAARGVPFLGLKEGISPRDLEAAEELAGVRVGSGDAIFVRAGSALRERAEGPSDGADRVGILPEVIPWLHDREVAMYSGDVGEREPSGYPLVPMPLHLVGLVAMGLTILDLPDLEALTEACRRYGRSEFLVVIAPLRIPGASCSPVNPIALF